MFQASRANQKRVLKDNALPPWVRIERLVSHCRGLLVTTFKLENCFQIRDAKILWLLVIVGWPRKMDSFSAESQSHLGVRLPVFTLEHQSAFLGYSFWRILGSREARSFCEVLFSWPQLPVIFHKEAVISQPKNCGTLVCEQRETDGRYM